MRFLLRFHAMVFPRHSAHFCGALNKFISHQPRIPNKRQTLCTRHSPFSSDSQMQRNPGPALTLRAKFHQSGEDEISSRPGYMPGLVRFSLAAILALAEDRRLLISLWTYIFVSQYILKRLRMLFVLC